MFFPNTANSYSDSRTSFAVEVKGLVIDYKVFGIFLLPNEPLDIRIISRTAGSFLLQSRFGDTRKVSDFVWRWQSPGAPGLYPVRIFRPDTAEFIELNVFVMYPSHMVRGGALNGYTIGQYPEGAAEGERDRDPPPGFIEVNASTEYVHISPHFVLGQFKCKQHEDSPKYIYLNEKLLIKLEFLLRELNMRGYYAETLHVMSGYRTPHWNTVKGSARYSYHQWGDAADIFVDSRPEDEWMDDLNRDGVINKKDAMVIFNLIEEMQSMQGYTGLEGGYSAYRGQGDHGPFVHVDVRGYDITW